MIDSGEGICASELSHITKGTLFNPPAVARGRMQDRVRGIRQLLRLLWATRSNNRRRAFLSGWFSIRNVSGSPTKIDDTLMGSSVEGQGGGSQLERLVD